MSRTWAELLGDEEPPEEAEERVSRRRRLLGRLRTGLSKSRRAITSGLTGWRFDPDDLESWEQLEEVLISADCGVRATAEIVRQLEKRRPKTDEDVFDGLEEILADLCAPAGEAALDLSATPTVILVVGVNGAGKTTTIGKLASRLRESGRTVIVAAADTYRAAAEEQLEIWAKRAGADFVGSTRGQDPAAVAFDAIEAARARKRDVVIVDTAGRLHTQTNLMEELAKVRRVIAQKLEGAPHETLLVLDATTGQNGLRQAQLFGESVQVTGVALTKLDGTAKGGIVVAIGHELGLPVKLVGVGEAIEDLQPFDAGDFARALVGRAEDE
ncbi:MAG: signal recognition particle-docking protein FtsY [Thermoleophilia bacterium]